MTAFFVATLTVKDPTKMQAYAKQAAETFKPFGGEMVMRGKLGAVLTGGDAGHQMTGIATFPTMPDLEAWYASDAYQAIIPLRDEAADIAIAAYDVPS
ncbi:DUF1330 domain-containing protein [Nisaea sp.]|uniref:DUF1330 domain-containing protein n=1 Tax=Nisaea sp. TaxID=2024842 RepID=UPI0032999B52